MNLDMRANFYYYGNNFYQHTVKFIANKNHRSFVPSNTVDRLQIENDAPVYNSQYRLLTREESHFSSK